MRRIVAAGILALLVTIARVDAQAPLQQQTIRNLYMNAVHSSAGIAPAERAIDSLRAKSPPGSRDEALMIAYSGAIRTLRAKHGRWPRARLRNLREGLKVLDRVAETHPEVAEIRYLRLMSCYYLPGMLGRGWSVKSDFRALATLLPRERSKLPPDLYLAVATFVLDRGNLTANERLAIAPKLGP